MKSVFETSLGIEAHMIKNLLALNDLPSEIFGEHLQSGVGDLQAFGVVRVMVSEEHYNEAHRIVSEWEAAQPEPAQSESSQAGRRSGFGGYMLAFIVGVATMFMLLQSPIKNQGIDYNNDGVLDEEWQYKGALISSSKIDQNLDGEFDAIYHYDLRGLLKSSTFDNDFNGHHETRCRYNNGNIVWCRGDADDDGFAEYREDYRFGIIEKVSIYDTASRLLVTNQYFVAGRPSRTEHDLDGDGVFETTHEYGPPPLPLSEQLPNK